MRSIATRLFVAGWLVMALAPQAALASSNYGRQAVELHLIRRAIEEYFDSHKIYPLTDNQSTWFEKLVADPVWGNQTVAFGVSAGGKFPLDMYGHPLVYESPTPANGNQVVIRSVGENGIDDLGNGDDWDIRYGPHYPYWNMKRWPAAYHRLELCIALAVIGSALLFWVFRRRRKGLASGLSLLWVAGLTIIVLPWGFDRGAFWSSTVSVDPTFINQAGLIGLGATLAGAVLVASDVRRRIRQRRQPPRLNSKL